MIRKCGNVFQLLETFKIGRGADGFMRKQGQKNIYAYISRLLFVMSSCFLLWACGGNSGDNGATADGSVTVEQDISKEESGQENLEVTGKSGQSAQDRKAVDDNEVSQENVDGADGDDADEESADLAEYNEERFFECAKKWEVDRAEAESHYRRLCDDNVFRNQTAWLVWVDIEDLDQNGQPDMAVMVKDDAYSGYGEGCIYFYMNEDEPYCFQDEEYPFHFGFNLIPGDFDHDGNTEIAFESLGSGVGGAGDWHPRILKYKDHTLEPMDFPGDDYDGRGIRIEITQEEKWNTYSAYSAYMDDTIVFEAENKFDPDASQPCGGNSRGYFNLWRSAYEGRDALEVSEILYGEGGVSHGLGLAKFLIVWDENGNGEVVKWWVEPFEN